QLYFLFPASLVHRREVAGDRQQAPFYRLPEIGQQLVARLTLGHTTGDRGNLRRVTAAFIRMNDHLHLHELSSDGVRSWAGEAGFTHKSSSVKPAALMMLRCVFGLRILAPCIGTGIVPGRPAFL